MKYEENRGIKKTRKGVLLSGAIYSGVPHTRKKKKISFFIFEQKKRFFSLVKVLVFLKKGKKSKYGKVNVESFLQIADHFCESKVNKFDVSFPVQKNVFLEKFAASKKKKKKSKKLFPLQK